MKRSTLITATAFAATAAIALPLLAFADDTFIPLTSLPGLASTSASAISLPSFINNLYRIAIGVAAFFAVVEIIWAGYLFMSSSDSISKVTKAREKIMNAVIGLVLVLSPYVVFSVINPSILNISLNFSELKSKNGTGGDVVIGAKGTETQLWVDLHSPRADANTRCTAAGGIATFTCTPKDNSTKGRVVPITEACADTENGATVCTGDADSIGKSAGTCTIEYSNIAVASASGACNGSQGYQRIDASCCAGAAANATCCGIPVNK